MKQNVIEVRDLSYDINGTRILSDISVAVDAHEFVGLIGPNGSGKSTLLKNIYRHFTPLKDTIFLNGKDVTAMRSREIAKQMAIVAQENNPDFDFSVQEMAMLGRYAHKKIFEKDNADDFDAVERALRIVGMEHRKERSFLSLSGGEKQRIYLAMAFAQESELIILDEPTNHLDIGYQLSMMETLRQYEGRTIFTSVHDMNLAAWYCDRIIMLDEGRVVAQGTPEEVLTTEKIREIFHVNTRITRREEDGKLEVSYLSYRK
ncbi:MAG: ABC transporter ATP-binding protein [Blautia sp.]|nr:ABC transporter ATP-binding protein [Blautia sp.]